MLSNGDLLSHLSVLPGETRTLEIVNFTDSGKLGIHRDHPHRWIKMKFCTMGGLQEIVLRFEFHQNRSSGFAAVGLFGWVETCHLSLIWPLAYTKS